MTKKEQAEMERLLTLSALRMTSPVERDLPPPAIEGPRDALTKGWDYNVHTIRVEPCCSSSMYHNFGSWEKTTTQQPRALYSTRMQALLALRHALEMKCAAELRKVDRMIDDEERECNSTRP
jgi:hypothetical protein